MILKLAGVAPPKNRIFDGKDPTTALTGRHPSPHSFLCWVWGSSTAIRQGRFKLIREKYSTSKDWQLFDLQTDVGETYNLTAARPELVQQWQDQLDGWFAEARTER